MVDPKKFAIPDISQLGAAAGVEDAAGGAETEQAHERLMSIHGVVMVGEGLDESGAPALIVGVRTAEDLARLPASFAGLPVRAEVIGDVVAQPLGAPPPR